MKNDAANKRAVEESTRNYTVSLAPRECSDVQSSNGFAICDNGSIAGTICDNELAVVSLQKPIPNQQINHKRCNLIQSKLSFCTAPKTVKTPITVPDSLFKQEPPKNNMKEMMKEVQKPTFSNSKYKSLYEFKLLSEAHEKKLQTDEPKEIEQKRSEEKIIPGQSTPIPLKDRSATTQNGNLRSDTMTVNEYYRPGGLHLKSTQQ